MKSRKKRSRALNIVLLSLMAFLGVLTVVTMVATAGKGMLPAKYVGLIAGIVAAIIIVSAFSFRKKAFNIVMIVISAVACAVMLYLTGFTSTLNKSIDTITAKAENVTTIKVAVLKESALEKIDDLSGKNVAYATTDGEEISKKAMDMLDSKVSDVTYTKETGISVLADKLRAGETDAIIVNNTYMGIFEEMDKYSGFEEEIKYIYEFDISTQIEEKEKTDKDSFILYISGIDTYGPTMATSRSDVNIIAAVNTKTRHIQLINTPRDAYVYLPNSGYQKDKLTHAGIYGIENSMTTLGNLYDIEIDDYMRVNFTGFEEIIDAIGGIDVESDYDFTITGGGASFKKGINHLTGIQALAFARERKAFTEGDAQRGKDQMAVIAATIKKLTSSQEILSNYGSIFDSISNSFQTSVPKETIYKLVNGQLSNSSDWKVDSYAITGSGTHAETYSMPGWDLYVFIPDDASIKEAKTLIDNVLNEK